MSQTWITTDNRPLKSKVSLNEQAYRMFRHRLITLQYKPGEYLNTAAVMEDLQLGRTPINQAIHRLATEGLLKILPRKGVMVSPLSMDDALELIEVRLVNEALCMQLAAGKVSDRSIRQLRELNQQIAVAGNTADRETLMLLDQRFHQQLADIAGNQRLAELLDVIHAQAQRFWAKTLSNAGHIQEVVAEHNAIIDALAGRDQQQCVTAARRHTLSFKKALLSL
ncbi:GntR family transcriptional regulator [Tatumella saanichensis]|uniref:GntR family transcriptional regulator n=1 Tax=Tatumella saanichensis TaxID=480813 RepID=UPI0004A451B6|nr:GntR family transcriptional regulator [Tatumella saanichensis]